MSVRACVSMFGSVFSIYLYLFVCVVACYSILDSLGVIRTQLQETRTGSRFMLVVDPIHRQFEDRLMGWSIDQYRFVQWRPDSDPVRKLRHFMWVFVFVSFSYLPLSICIMFYFYHFMWLFDLFYQCEYLYHSMSHERTFTLFILLIRVLVSVISCVGRSPVLA